MILTPIPAHLDITGDAEFVVYTTGDEPTDFAKAIEYAMAHLSQLKQAAGNAPDLVRAQFEWRIQGQRLAAYLERTFYASPEGKHVEAADS
jgi:hypothetical protein